MKIGDLRYQHVEKENGIALISALLLLMVLSALAVSLLYKVNMDQRMQKTDTENNLAYYGAEAGMEQMMASLDNLYAQKASPTCTDVTGAASTTPTNIGVTYTTFAINIPGGNGCTTPPQQVRTI